MVTTISIRVNKYLQKDFEILCKEHGYRTSEIFTIFEREYTKTGKRPFPTGEPYVYDNTKDVRFAITLNDKKAFEAACKKYDNTSMSRMLRDFMNYCVAHFYLPLENKSKHELILEELERIITEKDKLYRAALKTADLKEESEIVKAFIKGATAGMAETREILAQLKVKYSRD